MTAPTIDVDRRSTAVCPECRKRVGIFAHGRRVIFEAHTARTHGRLLDGDACSGTGWLVEADDL